MTTPMSEQSQTVRVTPASMAGPAAAGQADQVARILIAGYVDTPQGRWLIADRDERLITFGVFWPAMVRYGRDYGCIDVATDQAGTVLGAAIWFNPAEPGDPVSYRQCLADACRDHLARFLRFDQLLATRAPDPDDGLRLAWLAVARRHQGRGVASALLRYRHGLLDAAGGSAALVAGTARTRNLFGRHGYQTGRVFRLPGGPTLWPMLRPSGGGPGHGTPSAGP
ncbi:GNAT family N-acetyltransferase [Phytohabitans sp. ZYX-F-186]|uniref:GNAT family N-acetyltransferase n=1 Tax=Phytohabitans maris TaxID=3071409 RepID=A0ABU0ZE17_9ACTN|nr:GNAT family N-acetyltransferase [Phytohabitans sp. ZYX-F-186]MDQ7904674.1 GNAT family N-acetyltransferase [Phytohabitans sp. ZYX-F-186]